MRGSRKHRRLFRRKLRRKRRHSNCQKYFDMNRRET